MTVKDGGVRLSMVVGTEAGRQAIADNLGRLQDTLQQQGYNVEQMDVSLEQHASDSNTAGSDANPRHYTGSGMSGSYDPDNAGVEDERASVSGIRSRYLNMVA